MMRAAWVAVAGLIVMVCATGPTAAGESLGPYQKNERWGYKIRVPKSWQRRAVALDEPWIADKFFPAGMLRTEGTTVTQVAHRPDLWVIGFPHARQEERGVHQEKVGENALFVTIENPYEDYQDFVKREEWAAAGQGGWYVSREEDVEHGRHAVTIVEIKVEKLVQAPLRIVTWVYHLDDVDLAVQVRILEDRYPDWKSAIDASLRSFRVIPRTEPFPEADDGGPRFATPADEEKTLEELAARRRRAVEARIQREVEHLPKDWLVKQSKQYVILSQQDRMHTQYVLNFAEEIRKYLDKHLGDIGTGQVPRGVIRVFANPIEESAYRQGTRGWWTDEVDEIVMTFSRGTDILGEFSGTANRLTDQWLHAKNESLRDGLPAWLRRGLYTHISWARPSKRKKMVLVPTPSAVRDLAVLLRTGSALPVRTIIEGDTEDYASYEHATQAASVVQYLMTRGNKGKLKGALTTYMTSLVDIIEEEDRRFELAEAKRWREEAAARKEAEAAGEKTEEELERDEDERFRQRRQKRNDWSEGYREKYRAIRARAFQKAFGHLEDADWKKIDKSWRRFAAP